MHCMSIYRCKKVKSNGIEYRSHDGIILSSKDDVAQVGEILDIFVLDGIKILFQIKPYMTNYNSHYRVYLLKEITDAFEKFVLLHEILVANPVHIRTSSFFSPQKFVIFPYYL